MLVQYITRIFSQVAALGDEATTNNKAIRTILASIYGILVAMGNHIVMSLHSKMTIILMVLWLSDYLLGSALALISHRFRLKRSFYSFIKLLIWLAVFEVAFSFGATGDWALKFLGGIIEILVVLTEGLSVICNAAALEYWRTGGSGHAAKILQSIIAMIHQELDRRLGVVQSDTPTAVVIEKNSACPTPIPTPPAEVVVGVSAPPLEPIPTNSDNPNSAIEEVK